MPSYSVDSAPFQHSHPKVAGCGLPAVKLAASSFNTQPPEGGWCPRFGWCPLPYTVSTHSHPKVAGVKAAVIVILIRVSTHSHPKVAG